MEILIAESCRRTLADIRQGQFELSGPHCRIILPRIWEATLQYGWTVTIHFQPPRDEDPQLADSRDVIHEYRGQMERLERRIADERDRWEMERVRERERWEDE